MCVSPGNGFVSEVSISVNNKSIKASDTLKLLGFMFSSRPDVSTQFEYIRRKFQSQFWSLTHLLAAGLRGDHLFWIYTVFVRPLIEYNLVVYHPMLTKFQAGR